LQGMSSFLKEMIIIGDGKFKLKPLK